MIVKSIIFERLFSTPILTIGYSVGDGYKWSEKPSVPKSAKGDAQYPI